MLKPYTMTTADIAHARTTGAEINPSPKVVGMLQTPHGFVTVLTDGNDFDVYNETDGLEWFGESLTEALEYARALVERTVSPVATDDRTVSELAYAYGVRAWN
jgi:hypothetical protein